MFAAIKKSAFILIPTLIIVLLLSQAAIAKKFSPFKLELNVSKDTVFVDDTFDLIVHFEYSSDKAMVSVDDPEFPEMLAFEKVGSVGHHQSQRFVKNPVTGENMAQATYEFTRTYRALTPGEYKIDGIVLQVNDPAQPGGNLTVRTNTVNITVMAVGEDTEGQTTEEITEEEPEETIRDIKNPIPAPQWVLYLLGLGASSILLALALILARVIKPPSLKVPQKGEMRVIVAPYKRAIDKLKQLKVPDEATDDEKVTAFYIKLSDIVKEYVGSRHNVLGFEATTYEITSSMRNIYSKHRDSGNLIGSLESFLNEIDIGKYAQGMRDKNFMETAINKAREFIDLDNRTFLPPPDIDPELQN